MSGHTHAPSSSLARQVFHQLLTTTSTTLPHTQTYTHTPPPSCPPPVLRSHGNGVEQAFWRRADVLYVSLHQDGLYPLDTGGVEATGEGAGAGYNLNIPLPPGCGGGAYARAFEQVVEPALAAFKPDLILVSCGFDAAFLDPLGRMLLTSDDFRALTRRLREAAEAHCGGRLVFAHEGGYSEVYVPFCGVAVLEELCGGRSGVEDPFILDVGAPKWLACLPHQADAIAAAAKNLAIALVSSV